MLPVYVINIENIMRTCQTYSIYDVLKKKSQKFKSP